jgi:uncharacterized alpha-E superfamily protein
VGKIGTINSFASAKGVRNDISKNVWYRIPELWNQNTKGQD